MAATSTSGIGTPTIAPASRSRICHSGGCSGEGANTGSDHFRHDDTA
jgi:hypothetical protein